MSPPSFGDEPKVCKTVWGIVKVFEKYDNRKEKQEFLKFIENNTTIHLLEKTNQKEVTEMLAMGVLFGIIAICGFIWLYYSRSFKQAEVLLFQKGSLLTNQSRYLVCPKCGSAQARSGGYQECCKIRL